jgi:5,10-methylenetetrahydrofolate reductase
MMTLREKLLASAHPVTFFELVPPAVGNLPALETAVAEVRKVCNSVDAINLPEIRDENRSSERTHRFVPRVEPRVFGARLRSEVGADVVINRGVVYEPDPLDWFRRTREDFGIEHVVLVGGETSRIRYPGPGVVEAAEQVRSAGLPLSLGGISIPSRLREAERIRRKNAAGLIFFTTQVLFDSNDIVSLVQQLNGLEARLFLSFSPVSHPRDLEFLRWLGADIPAHLDHFLLYGHDSGISKEAPSATRPALNHSIDLARRILMDVFDNLPPDPPPLGLNIEHINRRNFAPAVRMLEELGHLYSSLVMARASLA